MGSISANQGNLCLKASIPALNQQYAPPACYNCPRLAGHQQVVPAGGADIQPNNNANTLSV